LEMPEWEFNHWLGYLLVEQEQNNKALEKMKHR
jgi:hypothetical protein